MSNARESLDRHGTYIVSEDCGARAKSDRQRVANVGGVGMEGEGEEEGQWKKKG